MSGDRLKAFLSRLAEGLVVIILVLLFFGFLFFGMNFFFPTGTTLKELVSRDDILPFADISITGDREFEIDRSREIAEVSAVLTGLRNTVKAKRSGSIAWAPASVGMSLHHRDAIQTFRRSSARISLDRDGDPLTTMDDESYLDVEENTLVIIKRIEEDLLLGEKESVLIMVDGKLRGKIKGSEEKSINVEVATPSAVTRVMSEESSDKEAAFTITVNPDKSSTITVYEGVAAVSAQDRLVLVEENQGVTVNLGQVPPAPKRLPAPPALSSPKGGALFSYRELPPKIQFSWNAGRDAETYHIVMARDPEFNEIVEDEYVSEKGFSHGNLREGEYFWRVSSLSDWAEGKFCDTRTVRVVKDLAPPMLRVELPGGIVKNDRVVLRGEAEPGARVFVQGEQVKIDGAGIFTHGVSLRRGTNVIVVEAVDAAGNVAYHSGYVNSRF